MGNSVVCIWVESSVNAVVISSVTSAVFSAVVAVANLVVSSEIVFIAVVTGGAKMDVKNMSHGENNREGFSH